VALIAVAAPEATPTKPARSFIFPLSARRAQVSELIAAGFTNAEIAASLGIAERTTDMHVYMIFVSLDFHRRSQIRDWVAKRRPRGHTTRTALRRAG